MSQAKVDRYKEEKKNRKKIMAKEKRMRIAGYVAGRTAERESNDGRGDRAAFWI